MKNRVLRYFAMIMVLSVPGPVQSADQNSEQTQLVKTNRLIHEKSPYLLQHAENPVDWYPWSDEAFEKAISENKPVFLSIGYSTCHWCHVMEEESFENSEIANLLNQYFVSIKVDREERPDIDHIYMMAVQLMTGSGGWPLTVFLNPQTREPFFGGTYFPPDDRWGRSGLKSILPSIHEAWNKNRKGILKSGTSLLKLLKEQNSLTGSGGEVLDQSIFDLSYGRYETSFDEAYGGFGSSPKFPSPHNLALLLRIAQQKPGSKALQMVEKTLDAMAQGGIHDHLGGGFHRYSTDQYWHVPHFEKMLYDQATLSQVYLEAYQITGKPLYADTARDIFDYVLREMTSEEGVFYSAQDADSAADATKPEFKTEGAYYVWTHEEMAGALDELSMDVVSYYFDVQEFGNVHVDPHEEFHGKNILFLAHTPAECAKHFKKDEKEIQAILSKAKITLLNLRSIRPHPHLDDKVLSDWNGLMIASLARGARVLGEEKYAKAAEKAAQFILTTMRRDDGRLMHRYRDGETAITGFLDDYAFFIYGLIELYQSTFNSRYLLEAVLLAQDMQKFFGDTQSGGFFLTGTDAPTLIIRSKDIYDGAIPSGNAIAALDLLILSAYTENASLTVNAQKIFSAYAYQILQNPNAYAQMLVAFDFYMGPVREIVFSGDLNQPSIQAMRDETAKHFLPRAVMALHPKTEGKKEIEALIPFIRDYDLIAEEPVAYVCVNRVCQLPSKNPESLSKLLDLKLEIDP
ncbi:MAG: thioredoxin domain-containing protein [Chlamydiota bacterium]|nr:thioredoxin domain-containing protein [Chlamydiota bacterium]